MNVRVIPQMRWSSLAKSGMAMVVMCLGAQALAQTTPSTTSDRANTADQARAAAAPNERATRTQPHREVRRGPVKPLQYPSNPQPPLPTRR